jgi:hypothetical protein
VFYIPYAIVRQVQPQRETQFITLTVPKTGGRACHWTLGETPGWSEGRNEGRHWVRILVWSPRERQGRADRLGNLGGSRPVLSCLGWALGIQGSWAHGLVEDVWQDWFACI